MVRTVRKIIPEFGYSIRHGNITGEKILAGDLNSGFVGEAIRLGSSWQPCAYSDGPLNSILTYLAGGSSQ